MVTIKITGLDKVKLALLDIEMSLSSRGRLPTLMNRIGRALRDDAKRTITTQDGGKWAPLGKWQRAKTGRRKALIEERERIHQKTMAAGSGAITVVFYAQRGLWALTKHAPGFTIAPHGKYVTVKLVDGTPLRLPKDQKSYKFRWVRRSVVPARRVFADRITAEKIIRPIVDQWLAELKARIK
jgi:hypothetical protein